MSKDTATAPTAAAAGKGYKSSSVPFLSRITFWWITPLLWRGFVEPLELENLGKLPEGDTARFHYDQFLSIYQRFKVSEWLIGLDAVVAVVGAGGCGR